VIEELLKAGARINARSRGFLTPVYLATVNNKPDAARVLIDAGADVNLRTRSGLSPLEVAFENCNKQIGAMLIEAGAKLGRGWHR
jgi:hypothetical protein